MATPTWLEQHNEAMDELFNVAFWLDRYVSGFAIVGNSVMAENLKDLQRRVENAKDLASSAISLNLRQQVDEGHKIFGTVLTAMLEKSDAT